MSGGPRIGLATRHSSKPTALSLPRQARIQPAVISWQIGPAGATNLTASAADYRGTTLAGGNVAAVARGTSDTATLWAATTSGTGLHLEECRHTNTSVTYTRLDSLAANSPGQVRQHYLRRSGRFEPRLDFVFELQFTDPSDTRPHLLREVQSRCQAQPHGRIWMDRARRRSRISPRRASPLIRSPAISTRPTTGAF